MSDRFAVVGANSFSGRAFVEKARERGDTVIDFTRPDFDLNRNPEDMAASIVVGDVRFVVNFAALNTIAESWAHSADYYRTNVIGVAALCDQLRNLAWRGRFVQVSTPEVYGNVGGLIEEGTPFAPSTPYAVSRAAIDMHLRALHKAFGFRVVFTRSVNVYGPGQQIYRIIPKTVLSILRGEKLKLHGGGVSRRAWIHVDDLANAIRTVALGGREGEDYHIATDDSVPIRWLVEMICQHLGVNFEDAIEAAPERQGKDLEYRLNDCKIRADLGWKDRISLEDGLSQTVDWFKDHAQDFAGKSLEYQHRP